jgi:hypothetical protein
MQVTRDGKQRRTESEWRQILSRQKRSGLSLREFARKESLPLASLQRWNRRLASAATTQPPKPDFVNVTPARTAPPPWQAEVELPNGTVLRFQG